MKKRTKRVWTQENVRVLKVMAKKRTRAEQIAKALKRSVGATRQKAFSLGVSLDSRS
jgi:coenzyme F420-reducing hydrogenase delta subunit